MKLCRNSAYTLQISGNTFQTPEEKLVVKTLGSPIATHKMLACSILLNHHSHELHDHRRNGKRNPRSKQIFFVCLCIICNKIFSKPQTTQKVRSIPQMLTRLLLFRHFPKMKEYVCEVSTFCLRTVEKRKEPFCSTQYPVFIFIKYQKLEKRGTLNI